MQWNQSPNGGFSQVKPWIETNNNFSAINVAESEADPDSILNYYRKVIKLKTSEVTLIYGVFTLIYRNHPEVYAYTRTFDNIVYTIICNFGSDCQTIELPVNRGKVILSNYPQTNTENSKQLAPYEAIVYRYEK
jgi:glycosidase